MKEYPKSKNPNFRHTKDILKVMQCKTTKHAYKNLKIVYEGASKVKKSKLQTYKGKFESLKMKEEENIAEYLLRLDEIVNSIIGIGGEIKEWSTKY